MPRPPLFGLPVQTIYRQTMLHHPIDPMLITAALDCPSLWAIASSLTPRGHAGKLVFDSKRCADCHSGTDFTDERVHDVGTIGASSGQGSGTTLAGINTPTLEGLWLSAPYLHNGSLATLAEVLADVTLMRSELTAPSKADLEAYLLQIDANSESPRRAQAQGNAQSATYRVTFEGKWTTTATPGGVPTGAHFSPLSGAVHNSGATFWSAGGTASLGIEAVGGTGEHGSGRDARFRGYSPPIDRPRLPPAA